MIDEEIIFSENKIIDWAYTEESRPISFDHYIKWVSDGYAGPLKYLSDERSHIRKDLKEYYPSFQSALVFLFSYIDEKKSQQNQKENFQVASYVTGFDGIDYHYWIKEKLQLIANDLKVKDPSLEVKFSIDTQPILERDLAYRAGLGWFGKNSMLINQKHGSYFIIASLLLNKKLKLPLKKIDSDHCGNCRACIDACPTDAIIDGKKSVDSNKCISTFTIELFKEAKPPLGYENENRIYGCDICQEVCPWNRKPINQSNSHFSENEISNFFKGDINEIIKKLDQMSNREFRKKFKGTPLERTGRIGILKNLKPFIN